MNETSSKKDEDSMKRESLSTLEPPSELSSRAQKVWEAVVPELHNNRVVGQTDIPLLVRYCDSLARWNECREIIDRDGMFTVNHCGNRVAKPELVQYKHLLNELLKIERELGMTPSARSQITKISVTEDDPFDYT